MLINLKLLERKNGLYRKWKKRDLKKIIELMLNLLYTQLIQDRKKILKGQRDGSARKGICGQA